MTKVVTTIPAIYSALFNISIRTNLMLPGSGMSGADELNKLKQLFDERRQILKAFSHSGTFTRIKLEKKLKEINENLNKLGISSIGINDMDLID